MIIEKIKWNLTMSFIENIIESLSNIEDKVESYNDHQNIDHKKCDYIELLALLNKDELYEDNLISRFFKEDDDRTEHEDNVSAEIDDSQERSLSELFRTLNYRQSMFEEHYPFIVTDDSIKLKEVEHLTKENKLYIVLLCCANLKKFTKKTQSKLTEEFEEITYTSIKKFLPQFELKRMGSNSDYRGNTSDKLKLLATDLNISTQDDQIDNLAKTASKEKGVDLFGWKKFKDKIPNMLMIAIQCACGEKTDYKINEPENYHNYLNFDKFKSKPVVVLSVPKAISIAPNSIKDKLEVIKTNNLFFDRLRLMEYIDNTLEIESLLLANKLIEKSISVVD